MAATIQPLVWDFYRVAEGASELGGVIHYYDEMSQSLWPSEAGLKTSLSEIPEGHWGTASPEAPVEVGTPVYQTLSLDHAYNGVLFGAAMDGDNLTYLRYIYAVDCSDIASSGNMGMTNSNSIVQLKANLMNTSEDLFLSESTVFQPGAKITFKILTDGDPYSMCIAYLDSVEYDKKSTTVPISGRNSIGFKLMESTFDDITSIEGLPHEVITKILVLAGIDRFIAEEGVESREYKFNPSQSLMAGLEQVLEFYPGMKMVELADGTIVVGYQNFIDGYRTNGYYVFDVGTLFKRKTKRSSDSAYTKVRVTGRDLDGVDLDPIMVEVRNYDQWKLPANKTFHATAPDGLTQAELQTYAENLAESLKYVGIGEDFTGPFQPQLLIGDVAAEDNGDGTMTVLGIITSLKHSFGKSGFTTAFSTDSGGILLDTRSNLVTVTKPLGGYTRKQTMKDMIQASVGSSAGHGQQVINETIKVIVSTDASTLQGKTYDQLVQDITKELGVGLDEIAALVGGDA